MMATLAEPKIDFTRKTHPAPVPGATRAEALADPGFVDPPPRGP